MVLVTTNVHYHSSTVLSCEYLYHSYDIAVIAVETISRGLNEAIETGIVDSFDVHLNVWHSADEEE